jgi:hypothetical protein
MMIIGAIILFWLSSPATFIEMLMTPPPEPTAVGVCSSAVAVHAASRRWLSFLRYIYVSIAPGAWFKPLDGHPGGTFPALSACRLTIPR